MTAVSFCASFQRALHNFLPSHEIILFALQPKIQYVLCFCARCEKQRNKKKGFSDLAENPFLFQRVSPTATKNANHRFAFPSQPKRQNKKTHTFREQGRTQNFSRAFDCGYSYFSQQKHATVRCVRSSGVSPAALRRCKTAYPCAYSRNKAKKRFVLAQRFMPAYN